jgi:hypothetical protein
MFFTFPAHREFAGSEMRTARYGKTNLIRSHCGVAFVNHAFPGRRTGKL